jgi:hypothetical protein
MPSLQDFNTKPRIESYKNGFSPSCRGRYGKDMLPMYPAANWLILRVPGQG